MSAGAASSADIFNDKFLIQLVSLQQGLHLVQTDSQPLELDSTSLQKRPTQSRGSCSLRLDPHDLKLLEKRYHAKEEGDMPVHKQTIPRNLWAQTKHPKGSS
jgi:hypothetical protein